VGEAVKYELRCVTCGQGLAPTRQAATCSRCGPLRGTLDAIYPLERLKGGYGPLSQYRGCDVFSAFACIFPHDDSGNLPPLIIGQTPLFKSPNISRVLGIENIYLKDESRNPSASLKDRASAVAIAMAKESGAKVIACASTGNAASSLATLAAAASIRAVVFIPKDAPAPKLTQIIIHGALPIRLDCGYDRAFDLCQESCQRFGWYNRNTAVNPFTGEGKKSVALEIAIDLGGAPDAVVGPVGDGCIIGGLYKGFADLFGLGLIGKMPRLYGVQAEGAAPLALAFEKGGDAEPLERVDTIADSIAVGCPRDGVKALRAVRRTGGAMIAVSDKEITEAQKTLASQAGVFAEPAAAAAYAGLLRLLKSDLLHKHETIALLLTGHGLKDVAAARTIIPKRTKIVAPDLDSITQRIKRFIDSER
jgi:threonine synthase